MRLYIYTFIYKYIYISVWRGGGGVNGCICSIRSGLIKCTTLCFCQFYVLYHRTFKIYF